MSNFFSDENLARLRKDEQVFVQTGFAKGRRQCCDARHSAVVGTRLRDRRRSSESQRTSAPGGYHLPKTTPLFFYLRVCYSSKRKKY
ncbi:hypothetical protein ABH945_007011 [Paraburkholderia sp. GAS333]